MAGSSSTGVVMTALGCNLGIALAKFAAAAWTGSSAMLSEAIHSLVDTSNQALLVVGLRRAARPADERHPFGYSKELYFWSFVVAILLFSLGSGVAIYEGVEKILDPHEVSHPGVNYIVLAIAFALEAVSTWKALGAFNARRGSVPVLTALRNSKDPALFAVLLEDTAALAGLCVAAIGIAIAHLTANPFADGAASIVIGLILGAVAAFMSIEIRSLIVGEAATPEVQAGLREILLGETGTGRPIRAINEVRTMHLGPEDILVAASVDVADNETARAVEEVSARVEQRVKARYPEVRRFFLEVQSTADHSRFERALVKQAAVESPKARERELALVSVAAPAAKPSDGPAVRTAPEPLSRKDKKRQKKRRP